MKFGELNVKRFGGFKPEIAEISYNDGDPVFPDPNVTNYILRPYVISILDFEKGFGHADLVMMNDEENKQ